MPWLEFLLKIDPCNVWFAMWWLSRFTLFCCTEGPNSVLRTIRSVSTPFLMLGGAEDEGLWQSFGGINALKTNMLHFPLLLWWQQVKSWNVSSYLCLPPCAGHHLSKHCSERILETPFPSCWHCCIPPWSSLSSSLRHSAFLCYCKCSQKNGRPGRNGCRCRCEPLSTTYISMTLDNKNYTK